MCACVRVSVCRGGGGSTAQHYITAHAQNKIKPPIFVALARFIASEFLFNVISRPRGYKNHAQLS